MSTETGDAAVAAPMKVLHSAVYRGPHLFSHTPMIRIRLDLGALEEWPTDRLPGFTDALIAMLPGLQEHGCSYGVPGGFIRRMREGTWLGHVTEHVALELQTRAGSRVTRGKTRSVRGCPGCYNVLYAYREEEVGLLAGRLALRLVDSLLPAELRGVRGLDELHERDPMAGGGGLEEGLRALGRLVGRRALGPTTRSLVQEAERRGIPVMRLDDFSLVQLGHGKKQQRLRASITGRTSSIAVEIAGDKDLTKSLLADAGIPVPKGAVVRSAEAAMREAGRIGYPVVTKPLDGNHGRGVSLDLRTPEAVRAGFEHAALHGRSVIVEQQFTGHDHRILVIGGEVRAVAQRVPAHVVGDGERSIAELIEEVNRDPRRGDGHEKTLTRIVVDDHVTDLLAKEGLTLESVPEKDRWVALRDTANLSTGGTAIDRTDDIHPENACIARRAAQIVGLDVAGIDFLAPDIRRSVRETGGGIVEVNAAPGFRMHLEPFEGWARDIARPAIDMLFPDGETGRIPIIAVTGTNGKSTTTRMVAHILAHAGLCVGMTSTSGIWVNGEKILDGDASGPRSARMVLREPTVEAAVLETARGGILREGLGFEAADIGAVLNIAADHLGIKEVDTLDDLAAVKSVVVESVRRDGCSVLNADDPLTLAMERHARGRIAFFSMKGGDAMPELLREHVRAGGLAVVNEDGPAGRDIVVHDDGRRLPLMSAAEIPATLGGMAGFNIQNALAAVAITYAQGISPPVIRAALQGFSTSFEQSPGRLNIHDAHGFRVILDYAHNPAGLAALCEVVGKLRPKHRRLIGMVSIPGDRRDEDIREMGRIAAGTFDEIVLRERPDGRGREAGEVIRLLAEGALAAGFPEERIHRVMDEHDATRHCLAMARRGDLVVLTPTSVEAVWAQVLTFTPEETPALAAEMA
ncbi:cyanophycin synthetase [Roseomonas sp. SSH11]|uniref:Cyanophycin synthetase n=1 Tax=Pararoseomonas baculiformis TaxID=2820812 RepID=A0ABS4AE37_9PROT|nr:cyanophycin synthetase [Pararoseomonas baculiformis]MBP0445273.1 cyanophycin synthetase [Pararoseomonas baculiformis]